MNKKLENLVKIWEESKFKVICRDVFEEDGEILEINLFLKPLSGQSWKFNDNWDDIKYAASRQGFYAIPIIEKNIHGNIGICLIKKESIYQIHKKFRIFIELNNAYYWTIQGDALYTVLSKRAFELAEDIHQVQKSIRRMQSNTKHSYLFDNKAVYELWKSYKERVRYWVADTRYVDHLDEVKDIADDIFYRYNIFDAK